MYLLCSNIRRKYKVENIWSVFARKALQFTRQRWAVARTVVGFSHQNMHAFEGFRRWEEGSLGALVFLYNIDQLLKRTTNRMVWIHAWWDLTIYPSIMLTWYNLKTLPKQLSSKLFKASFLVSFWTVEIVSAQNENSEWLITERLGGFYYLLRP